MATTNPAGNTPALTRGDTNWAANLTLDSQSKSLTLNTADKYVDKDIELTIAAQDGAGSISGGALTHGEITTTDTTYLTGTSTNGYKVTINNEASVGEITVPISKAGWIDNGDISKKAASGTHTATKDFYVKKGSASVVTNQSVPVAGSITNNNGNLTATLSGSASIAGTATTGWVTSVSAADVTASGKATAKATDLDKNLVAGNIIKGATIFGVTGTEDNAVKASFANKEASGKTYTDISADAPALISGSYLYIHEGYVDGNKKISLAKLVPDGSNIKGQNSLMYKTVQGYDDDGNLIAGSMDDATIKSGAPSLSGTPSVGAKNTSTNKYPLVASVSVAAPSVIEGGYITSSKGTKNTNSGSIAIELDAATCKVSGGKLTPGDGSSSINVNGYWDGSKLSTTDKIDITTQTSAAAGYYKIGTIGNGSVNRSAITDKHTAGWLEAKAESNVIGATSLTSNSGTSTYYIKKSTGSDQSWKPNKDNAHTVTIGKGYYPTDRVITVSKVDPTDATQVAQGALKADGSVISSVSATAGTPTVNTNTYKYNIPLTLSASGTAYAKVATTGYVTSTKDTSLPLSGSGSANVSLDLYNGAYSWS